MPMNDATPDDHRPARRDTFDPESNILMGRATLLVLCLLMVFFTLTIPATGIYVWWQGEKQKQPARTYCSCADSRCPDLVRPEKESGTFR
jgi:hypothetical protein